jgi:hypothetical protein
MRTVQIVNEINRQKNSKYNVKILNSYKDIKNSVIIFIKHFFIKKLNIIKKFKKNNNKIVVDVLDWLDQTKMNNENYDAPNLTKYLGFIDYFIVMNELMKSKYENKYKKKSYIIKHHWDPRITKYKQHNNLNKAKILFNGFIGHKKKNCLYVERLVKDKLIIHNHKFTALRKISNKYNCHISVRKKNSWEYLFKPSIKLYMAAALNCNIIITDDIGIMEMLNEDYPYLIKSSDLNYENVVKMIKYVRETYGTDIWNNGLKILKEIKNKTSIEQIVKNYYYPFFDDIL